MALVCETMHVPMGIDLSSSPPPPDDRGITSDDEEYSRRELKDGLEELDQGLRNLLVVDNVPQVPPEKYEKLRNVVGNKIFNGHSDLSMPVDSTTQETLGFCFIEFKTPQEAELAKEKTNGLKMDKSHELVVNTFDEFDKYMEVPDQWTSPESKPYSPGENLQRWLTDPKARDQFVVHAGQEVDIHWNDSRLLRPELVYKRQFWTESFVQWSPLGTYLATVHRQGVQVWGGASTFNRLSRFDHPEVKLIDFSPGEKYLVTYSSHEPTNPYDIHRVVLKIFDVRTGKMMREFSGSADEFSVGGTGGLTGGISWPFFKWAGGRDDKYFARLGKNAISVYETDSFGLIDKKSIKVENVVDFSWSPTDSILSVFVPELGKQPAKVSLYEIPSKVEIRQNYLFSVSNCKMYWHSNGEYLAVKVDRYTKTKKSTYSGFEIFRIKERDMPIEVLELENKTEKIIAFAWEPKGHRFAVVHGDNPRPDVSFYSMKTAQNTSRVSKQATLKSRQANALYWSPGGRFIVLAGLKGFNGQLEFFNVDELETMATVEHFKCTDVEWDPTGRYVATSVTSVHAMDNGFNIWSFNGKFLYKIPKDYFLQFSWRPRPPSILSPEDEEEIVRKLKQYRKKYEAEDKDVTLLLDEEERERRMRLKIEWDALVSKWKMYHEAEKLDRQILRDGEVSDEENEYEAKELVELEEVIDVQEEIVSSDDQ